MSKSTKRRKTSPRRKRPRQAKKFSGPYELTVVDSSKIRRKAITACKRSRTTFQKAEGELLEFEETHLPAFEQWLHKECGPLLEEIKSTRESIQHLLLQREEIEELAELKDWPETKAGSIFAQDPKKFARLLTQAREHEAQAQERMQRQADEKLEKLVTLLLQDLDAFLESDPDGLEDIYNIEGPKRMKAMVVNYLLQDLPNAWILFERICHDPRLDARLEQAGFPMDGNWEPEDDDFDEEFDDIEREFERFISGLFGAPPPPDPKTDSTRIKALKREMAFALHPDQGGDDPKKMGLWHEVQAAAEAGDLDRMEVLHAHMQVMSGELSPHTPVSKLQRITHMYRQSRNALRRRIRKLRKDPAWNFTRKSNQEKSDILRQHLSVLELEKEEHLMELRWARQDLEQLARKPHTRPPRPPQSNTWEKQQEVFDFF